ncbi:MAG: RecX family transcriptional regulator [Oscillatoriales cyanobacterium]|nr:MAG: RecX family transcriptional regulator [Oscillatoriales cyanobacterium]
MSCLDYFYFLLSRKDYSFGNEEILEAIAQIQDRGYQSDTRLVANSIASATGKYGKSAIKRKCLQKGITSDLFEQVWEEEIAENLDSEAAKLAELKAKVMRKYKIDAWSKVDPKTKGKVLNYLQYRGFNAFELLRQWQTEEDEGLTYRAK